MRDTSLSEVVTQGEHGLYYITDRANRGVFVAATTAEAAKRRAEQARIALLQVTGKVPHHEIYEHPNGGRITVPVPEPMTPEQRQETVLLLQRHLVHHFECH